MRFLIGIVVGSALTLFAATAVDGPSVTTLGWLRTSAADAWDDLIDTTSNSLFSDDARSTPELPARAGPPNRAGAARTPMPDSPSSAPAHAEPAASEATDSKRPGSEATDFASPEANLPGADPAFAGPASEPLDQLEAPEPAAHVVEVTPTASAAGTGAERAVAEVAEEDAWADAEGGPLLVTTDVWLPFHSQMSAEGFAARLSRELDRPFEVERRGAGAYQVVLSGGSSAENAVILDRVAELTGR